MSMDTATLEPTTAEDITRFIDAWLDENSWRIDSGVIDFALDVRRLLADLDRS